MPVEVLTREEIEKIIEEKLRKLPSEMEIWKEITEFKSSILKLKDDIAKLSVKEPEVARVQPLSATLMNELGERVDLLDVRNTSDSVTLKPKRYLGTQDFSAVREMVRRHGGFWSSQRRMFIVRKPD